LGGKGQHPGPGPGQGRVVWGIGVKEIDRYIVIIKYKII
jgi:hypothetical protein